MPRARTLETLERAYTALHASDFTGRLGDGQSLLNDLCSIIAFERGESERHVRERHDELATFRRVLHGVCSEAERAALIERLGGALICSHCGAVFGDARQEPSDYESCPECFGSFSFQAARAIGEREAYRLLREMKAPPYVILPTAG